MNPSFHGCFQIQEADLLEVTTAMGLEDEIDATDDIGAADAILATSTEMKQNPWIRSVAKFHQVPVFVIKVPFLPPSCLFPLFVVHLSGKVGWCCILQFPACWLIAVKYNGTNGEGGPYDSWNAFI